MLRLLVHVRTALLTAGQRVTHRHNAGSPVGSRRGESGQATAEYALVLLGVAAIALLVAAWAAKSGKIGQLLDAVVGQLISKAK